jgi:hypothetical protein
VIKVEMKLQGAINLDKFEVELHCPRCNFSNRIWLKQAWVRDVLICRGCKGNIQLDDGMNSVRKAYRTIRQALQGLRDTVEGINRNFR